MSVAEAIIQNCQYTINKDICHRHTSGAM